MMAGILYVAIASTSDHPMNDGTESSSTATASHLILKSSVS